MDKLTELEKEKARLRIREMIIQKFVSVTVAAAMVGMEAANLNSVLTNKSNLALHRLGALANGWRVDISILLPLLSERDREQFDQIRSAITKEYVEVLPSS